MNIARSVFVGALLLCGCSREAPETPAAEFAAAPADLSMSARHIGPVQVGVSTDAIEALNLPFETEVSYGEGDEYLNYILTISTDASVTATTYEGAVVEVSTLSPAFENAQGAHVGMSLDELRALYPNGVFYIGAEAGEFMSFSLLPDGGVFSFDIAGIDAACFQPRRRCPTPLGPRRATRYFVR